MCRRPIASDSTVSGLDLVIQKACTDCAFRRALLADPHAAIASSFGLELPARFRLRFIEKPNDVDVVVVLPDLAPDSTTALSPEALDQVNGGHDLLSWLTESLAPIAGQP
jgi:hypothetical protein